MKNDTSPISVNGEDFAYFAWHTRVYPQTHYCNGHICFEQWERLQNEHR